MSQQGAPSGTNDDPSPRLLYQYSSDHPHPYPGDYYYHYYPPPPYHPAAYIGHPPNDEQTPTSGSAPKAYYAQQHYDVDAFTPRPPKSSRSHRATPPTITPHDWIPEGFSSPKRSPYFETPDPPAVTNSGSSESTESQGDRPVPARSAFMCFMQARMGVDTNEAAEAWRVVSKEERAHWENVASKDRKRYNLERKDVDPSVRKVRRKKDPSAPKRPMSAFLMFAQTKRRQLQAENPDIPNADISRMLGEKWRSASPEDKAPFLEREQNERRLYKAKMEKFKCDQKLAKSLALKLDIPTTAPDITEHFDQREDEEEEPLAHRVAESTRRFAPPNINQFGAAYPVEAAYHYSPYGGFHPRSSDRSFLTPVQELKSSINDSGVKFSYPRPDDEEK
mmetsp:Transcript_2858/g.4383  ORF Transcript_2858/g.4383 Transcript_2858/m.4383 type:complete len:392 (+) Transcript_2858:263-1438(+)